MSACLGDTMGDLMSPSHQEDGRDNEGEEEMQLAISLSLSLSEHENNINDDSEERVERAKKRSRDELEGADPVQKDKRSEEAGNEEQLYMQEEEEDGEGEVEGYGLEEGEVLEYELEEGEMWQDDESLYLYEEEEEVEEEDEKGTGGGFEEETLFSDLHDGGGHSDVHDMLELL